jgi:uncharacterized protein (DUF342 family)
MADTENIPDMNEEEMQALMQEILKIQQDDTLPISLPGEEAVPETEKEQPEKVKSYVRLSPDRMRAWVLLSSDSGVMKREAFLAFLKKNNVMRGYISDTFTQMVKEPLFDRELLIAAGREPDEGRDGYYEFLFEPEKYQVPRILEDGTVDYASMNRLANVRAGECVAIYHPAISGRDGFNVCGEVLKAHVSRELPPMYGKEIRREGNRYIAKVDGKIEEHHGHVDIQQVHEVHGDVGAVMGKIEFFGDVIVYGNVEAGAMIRAGRNIDIRGTASDAVLSAGGDIIITRGISCSARGKVTARGNLMSDFIENARVEVQGNVTTNSILNSYVSAGGEITVNGRKSVIVGGYTHGFRGIKASNVGNDTEKKTVLHSGYEVNLYDSYLDMKRRENGIKRELSAIVAQITNVIQEQRILNLRNRYQAGASGTDSSDRPDKGTGAQVMQAETGQADPAQNADNAKPEGGQAAGNTATSEQQGSRDIPVAERIETWTKKKNQLFSELEQIRPVREKLEEKIMLAQQARIEVGGRLYAGTVISINDKKYLIRTGTSFMKYSIKYGAIEGEVMVL